MKIQITETELQRLKNIAENGINEFALVYDKNKNLLKDKSGKYALELDNRIINLYDDALKSLAIDIENIVNKYIGRDLSLGERMRIRRTTGLYNAVFQKLENLGVLTKAQIQDYMKLGFEYGYYTDSYTSNSQIKFILEPAFINQGALNYAINNLAFEKSVNDLPAALKFDIENVIGNNIIRGKGIREITRAIKPLLNNNKIRARRIAQTETARCYSAGQLENDRIMSDNGLLYAKTWLTSRLSNVRPQHRLMEGKQADSNGLFHLPDGSMGEAPRMTGVAHQDINCHCSYITQINGINDPILQEKYLQAQAEYKPYEDWINDYI